MLPIMQFEMIQGSTGSASLCTNTGSFAVSHLQERNTEDSVERVTGTTKHALLAGPLGKGTTRSPFVGIVDFGSSSLVSCLPFVSSELVIFSMSSEWFVFIMNLVIDSPLASKLWSLSHC